MEEQEFVYRIYVLDKIEKLTVKKVTEKNVIAIDKYGNKVHIARNETSGAWGFTKEEAIERYCYLVGEKIAKHEMSIEALKDDIVNMRKQL